MNPQCSSRLPTKKASTGEAGWNKWLEANKDSGYGFACLRYASEWATRMETAIKEANAPMTTLNEQITFLLTPSEYQSKGEEPRTIPLAEKLSYEADDEGITGFMYGCAVNALCHCWIYGEALRRWHNKQTQIGSEGDEANESGGVLNPALLCVGSKS